MKYLLCLFVVLFTYNVYGQKISKNNIYSSYSYVLGEKYAGGNLTGHGFTIGYSRYLSNRFYGDISYGKLDYEGENSSIFLPKEETGRFDMSFFTLGIGYDLIQRSKFILSSEAVFLRISNTLLQHQIGDGDYMALRETGRSSDITAKVGLKARVFLTDQLQLIPSVAYGLQIQRYETRWLNIGVGYSF
ncbi:hypothetical protein [Anditalea andensis]|uniref:Outer membrane protein beta-barrel domain-containing protein n=1 Tax=Anditalea andensis TaxID=1048983 RepID=A0A074L7X4_9BACT|nr:hypothetical protein [Anditalea andensis]KEO75953.1 hypothetical protein EL17_00125 [Anditalea andensis]